MAYVGTPLDTTNAFQSLAGKRFNGDGSTTDFTLDSSPNSTLDIEVFVGNVRQDPNSAYTVSGTTLAFTGAPPSGTNNIYVVHQAKAVGTIDPAVGSTLDLNGAAELILDADADTTIAADTDDQIDIKVGNTDILNITNSSSDAVITQAVQDKDIIFKGDDGGSAITALTIDMSDGGILQTRAGVGFPATQVASSGANVLDDYEEGTFTGGFTFGGSATGIAYNRTVGIYTKIGDLVFVQGYVSLTSKGSQTGNAALTGLPFTSSSASNASSACGNMRVAQLTFANDTHLSISIQSGGVILDLCDTASGAGATFMTNDNFADNTGIEFGFAYTV
jgi:hypothetical protein